MVQLVVLLELVRRFFIRFSQTHPYIWSERQQSEAKSPKMWNRKSERKQVRSPIKDILLARRLKHSPIGGGWTWAHWVGHIWSVWRWKTLEVAMPHLLLLFHLLLTKLFRASASRLFAFLRSFESLWWEKGKCGWNPKNPDLNCCDKCNLKPFSDIDSSFWEWRSKMRIAWKKKCHFCHSLNW